jgi:hypothetical protein
MATREEIIAELRRVNERLDALAPAILARPETPLPEGTWTVHDAVCHLAADGNAVPRFLHRVEVIDQGLPLRPPGWTPAVMDAENEENIAKRKGLPITDVLKEIREAMDADIERVKGLDEALLLRDIPNFRGEIGPASDQLKNTTSGHPHNHINDIERALATPSS